MGALRTGAVALALALLALGIAVVPLETPGLTRMLVSRYAQAGEAGLSSEMMIRTAEQVRVFVVDGRGRLPESIDGRAAFDASAASHLADVRDVLTGARIATGALALGLAIWLGWATRRRDVEGIARALMAGGAVTCGFLVLALLASVADFESFFAAFHSLFFASGTWQFPADALLILVFPEPFWVAAGGTWASVTAVIGTAYWLLGKRLARGADPVLDGEHRDQFDTRA